MDGFDLALSDILEVESVNLNDSLSAFDSWGSLTLLSVIAYCDAEHHVVLSADEIIASETIGGLKQLIASKK